MQVRKKKKHLQIASSFDYNLLFSPATPYTGNNKAIWNASHRYTDTWNCTFLGYLARYHLVQQWAVPSHQTLPTTLPVTVILAPV